MQIERSIEIARPPEDVFELVSDPQNDLLWCPKVESVELQSGAARTAGATYAVMHRPIPFRPPRRMDHRLVEIRAPELIVWREDDGRDTITATYLLEPTAAGTRFTQRDEADLGAPRLLYPVMRVGIAIDIAHQLRELRDLLQR